MQVSLDLWVQPRISHISPFSQLFCVFEQLVRWNCLWSRASGISIEIPLHINEARHGPKVRPSETSRLMPESPDLLTPWLQPESRIMDADAYDAYDAWFCTHMVHLFFFHFLSQVPAAVHVFSLYFEKRLQQIQGTLQWKRSHPEGWSMPGANCDHCALAQT